MSKSVTVYSTPTCPYCVRAKEYLKANNIEYADIDVSSDEAAGAAMVEKSGQMGVPVIDIDGEIIIGFDKEKIKKTLGI
jgi:glutaredoxin 3